MVIASAGTRQDEMVRVEGETCDGGGAVLLEEAGVGFNGCEGLPERRAHDVPHFNVVVSRATVQKLALGVRRGIRRGIVRSYNRCMFMYTQTPHTLGVGTQRAHRGIHSDIPELDFTCHCTADKLPHPAALHMHFNDPRLMILPSLDHRFPWW